LSASDYGGPIVSSPSVFLQAGLLGLVAVGGLFPQGRNSLQSATVNAPTEVILEVDATQRSMDADYAYLYLRVFSDSTAEYQPRHPTASGSSGPLIITKTLAQDGFKSLESVLQERSLARLGGPYESQFAILDSWTEWKIRLQNRGRPRTITVLEFSPGLAKAVKRPYPDALVKLGCTLGRLRSDVSGEPPVLDSGCKKVFKPAVIP
jgi:hypothetical protein